MMEMKEIIDKCLFFVGSGFSRPAGCKVSSEMLNDLRKRIQYDREDIFNRIEKEALKFLLSCLSFHCEWRSIQSGGKFRFSPNIEELILLMRRIKARENYLPYPVTGNWADKLVQLEANFNSLIGKERDETDNLFSSIEFKIKSNLLKNWLEFDQNKLSYLEPFKKFLEDYPYQNFCMDIFSLNYDLVLEKFFSEAGLWKGFSNSKWVGLDSHPNNEERRRINLYKLHGSLNWIRDEAGDIWEKEGINRQELESDPFIIFGQGTKTFSIDPFFSLIYHFRKLLTEREYIFIIGYSFFDPYINNLLFSITVGTSKRLVIVNPDVGIEMQEQNTKNKFGECQGYKERLSEYLKEIQRNPFYSELPEFNVSQIRSNSLFYISWKAEEFIKRYFSNKGTLLKELIEQFEKERKDIEKPFK